MAVIFVDKVLEETDTGVEACRVSRGIGIVLGITNLALTIYKDAAEDGPESRRMPRPCASALAQWTYSLSLYNA
jgi:hypothetical protein